MDDIRAGDTVVCEKTNDFEHHITEGKKYIVIGNDEFDFKIYYAIERDDGIIGYYEASRFKKVESKTQQPAAKPAGGLKYDSNKPPVDLVPREAIEAAARAFGFGARKYAAHNFKLGLQYSRLAGAVQRHLLAYMDGESIDPESGLSHLDHAMSALSMLVYMSQNKPEMDDRFNKQTLKLNNET